MKQKTLLLLSLLAVLTAPLIAQGQNMEEKSMKVKLSFGHKGQYPIEMEVRFKSDVPDFNIINVTGKDLKTRDTVSSVRFGAGEVDELTVEVTWTKPRAELIPVNKTAKMWAYFFEHGSPGQIERIQQDPWNQPDAPLLTVQLNEKGTEGFSVSLENLRTHGAIWLPEHDIFLTDADHPLGFEQHLESLAGMRTLDRVNQEPDASLAQFRNLWTDFGNPVIYDVPWQTKYMGTVGHLIITATAHGSIYKFAIDRWGNVRPDFASPHRFRLDTRWKESRWISQKIEEGLPVVLTQLENRGQTLEIEQFASPIGEIEAAIRGYIPGVMFSKLKFTGQPGPIKFELSLTNEVKGQAVDLKNSGAEWTIIDHRTGDILLMLEADDGWSVALEKAEPKDNGQQLRLLIEGELKQGQSREVLVKFPSPSIAPSQEAKLAALDYSDSKNRVVNYWEEWLAKGAQIQVPEQEVNDLFRANLWHALILPRHTIGLKGEDHMDLPYANTAYGQQNSDWPINQGVYVDYMIYGLRGYDEVAGDEFAAMFHTQQQPDGRMGGFAHWGVYSPAHLYAIAQNYLLSGNKEQFEKLLPNALKTLDWCLTQISEAHARENSTGLILGALNDLSHSEQEWAFTQAYYVGGLDTFGKALSLYNHPRAEEVNQIAAKMKSDVEKEFSRSSVKSPVVQLADGSWINYVPTDAMTPRRLVDQWYPTDVDTGPLHLTRLGALEPEGWLTTAMLNDHEDNLFFKNWGAANEPIYIQQANAYLLRDQPKAVIRSFYSLMAAGFSQHQFSPLEHQWAHPQYYGPPSTDGAWFEILRKMLLNEWAEETLMIGQAIPRDWLTTGKEIKVEKAPSYFGEVSFSIQGISLAHEISATVVVPDRNTPKELLVRFRHPGEKPIVSVEVDGMVWKDFDVEKEYIRIPNPEAKQYLILARYE